VLLLAVLFVATGLLRRDAHAPREDTNRVFAGWLSIEVPADWPKTFVPQEPCLDLKAPGVLVGTFAAVRNCYMQLSTAGPAVTFASGGPPEPPVPTGEPESRSANGVAVLVATADLYSDGTESEFMALFPEWDVSLRVGVKGGRSAALEAGNALLDTIRVIGARAPTPRSSAESFLGHWHVHGALLDIDPRTARLTVDCSRPDQPCIETFTLTLSLSHDGRRLDAEITDDSYTEPSTGKPVPNPDPGLPTEVGSTSYFEFVAPHLLKETFLHSNDTTDDDFGNPYWCGERLDPSLSDHCGL
jgi:hypothetical protein